jgi:hypothetical protein
MFSPWRRTRLRGFVLLVLSGSSFEEEAHSLRQSDQQSNGMDENDCFFKQSFLKILVLVVRL